LGGGEYVCWDGTVAPQASLCPKESTTSLPPAKEFYFSSGKGGCGSPKEIAFNISGKTLHISGAIQTPTPCYALSAEYAIKEDALTIELSSRSKGGVCVECLGAVPFKAELRNIPYGRYQVRLRYGGRALIKPSAVVSQENDLYFYCWGGANYTCSGGLACELLNQSNPEGGGRCVEANPT
jgi:hypothetical protein